LSLKVITIEILGICAAGRWFSPATPVSSTNKADHHGITEISLTVAFNTTTVTPDLFL
jgi:hypothetical protein